MLAFQVMKSEGIDIKGIFTSPFIPEQKYVSGSAFTRLRR
jgi:hypothetical protein